MRKFQFKGKLRNGMHAYFDRLDDSDFPFIGIVVEQHTDGWNSWREDGKWRQFGEECEMDLVDHSRI